MASKIVINLDTSKETFISAKCKQNDDLILEASIFENGLTKDLTNAAIIIQAKKPDNTYIIQNTNITKENNKIIANLDRDFTRAAGKTEIEILLVESGKQNTTFSFVLEVVGSVIRGAVESSNTVTILEELDNKIVEAGQVKAETEQLIVSGGAATKGDIDLVNASLAEKVNKTSIINNLTTGGATNVLSAEQGKILKAQIDGNTNESLNGENGWFKDKKTGYISQYGMLRTAGANAGTVYTATLTLPVPFPNKVANFIPNVYKCEKADGTEIVAEVTFLGYIIYSKSSIGIRYKAESYVEGGILIAWHCDGY